MVHDQRPDEGQGGSATIAEDFDAHGPEGEGHDKAKEGVRKTKEKTEELKERGKDAARDMKHEAEEEMERRSSDVAYRLASVERALQSAADELHADGQRGLARFAHRGANQVNRAIGYLDRKDAPSMVRDLEDKARSNPAAFLGTTFATGLAVGRFLRSSQRSRHESGDSSGTWDDDSASRERAGSTSPNEGEPSTWEGDSGSTGVMGASTAEVASGVPVRDERDEEVAHEDDRGGDHGTAY